MHGLRLGLILTSLFLGLMFASCSDNSELAVPVQEQLILSVVLEADTIYTPTGNVSHIYGYAEMTSDKRPYGLPGFKLDICLGQPWLSMSLTNERYRDVTDEGGRVTFFVRDQLRRESHYSTIHADWGVLSASDSVWIEITE